MNLIEILGGKLWIQTLNKKPFNLKKDIEKEDQKFEKDDQAKNLLNKKKTKKEKLKVLRGNFRSFIIKINKKNLPLQK